MRKNNHNEEAMKAYFEANYTEDSWYPQGDFDAKIRGTVAAFNDYDWDANIRRTPNKAERMAEWFKGLPTPFYPEPFYMNIEALLRQWGILEEGAPESRVNKMAENWWTYWAQWVLRHYSK